MATRLLAAEPDETRIARYPTAHRARKGDMVRFVLTFVREAGEPVTSIQITMALLKARGLSASDDTIQTMRKRVGPV